MKKGTPMSAVTMPMGRGPRNDGLGEHRGRREHAGAAQGGEGIKSADLPHQHAGDRGPPGRQKPITPTKLVAVAVSRGDQHQGLHAQSVDIDPEAAGAGFLRAGW